MGERIVILTGAREQQPLADFVARLPDIQGTVVTTQAALAHALAEDPAHTRLVAFLTSVIVPAALLTGLGRTPYNVHPGPPTLPGLYPECWAAYFGLTETAVTVHELAARVDSGRIVAVHPVLLPPAPAIATVAERTYAAAVEVVAALLRWCATSAESLPPTGHVWSGVQRTKSMYEEMIQPTPALSAHEAARRARAFILPSDDGSLKPPSAPRGSLPARAC